MVIISHLTKYASNKIFSYLPNFRTNKNSTKIFQTKYVIFQILDLKKKSPKSFKKKTCFVFWFSLKFSWFCGTSPIFTLQPLAHLHPLAVLRSCGALMGSGEHGPHVIPWQLGSETSAKMEEMEQNINKYTTKSCVWDENLWKCGKFIGRYGSISTVYMDNYCNWFGSWRISCRANANYNYQWGYELFLLFKSFGIFDWRSIGRLRRPPTPNYSMNVFGEIVVKFARTVSSSPILWGEDWTHIWNHLT